MNEVSAIALFCLVDDVLNAYHNKRLRKPSQEAMSDAEVVFTGIVSAFWFAGNLRRGISHIADKKYCLKILSEGRFLRRLKAIPSSIWAILQNFLAKKACGHTPNEFVIDSFPQPVCRNIRISRCRIVKGAEYRGYNASKQEYFFGLKVHAIASTTGVPISFEISPGSMHDLVAFKMMNMDAVEGGTLYGDAAYTDYSLEDQLARWGAQHDRGQEEELQEASNGGASARAVGEAQNSGDLCFWDSEAVSSHAPCSTTKRPHPQDNAVYRCVYCVIVLVNLTRKLGYLIFTPIAQENNMVPYRQGEK